MYTTRHETFFTPEPVMLRVRTKSGHIRIVESHGEATVEVSAEQSVLDAMTIHLTAGTLTVAVEETSREREPGFLGFLASAFGERAHTDVRIAVPRGSSLQLATASGDVTVDVAMDDVDIDVSSGDVDVLESSGETRVRTVSGDIGLQDVARLEAKTGSGDVRVGDIAGEVRVTTGSGDITIGDCAGGGQFKSGSGDLTVGAVSGSVMITTGSGDLTVARMGAGSLSCKTAAGDIVIGVEEGMPVWTDISTLTGEVASDVRGGGQPAAGEAYLELRATTVAGDVRLREVARDLR